MDSIDGRFLLGRSRPVTRQLPHVVVVGGGNAGLCAAMAASDARAQVTVLERAPRPFRGGNTRHTRNLRTLHESGDGYVTGAYSFGEFYTDLAGVSNEHIDPEMAALTIRESATITEWMASHGGRWQAPLKGTLSLARTNHFFLGGGKSLLNSYYHTAEDAGVRVHYDADVVALDFDGDRCTGVRVRFGESEERTIPAAAVVLAAGGYEANRTWLREGWGDAASSLIVRGTRYNDGAILKMMIEAGARTVGDPRGAHAIAVDARAPAYDAGIITRLDAIPIGIVVNRSGARFSDEGADIWPKRYASWGRLIAEQPGNEAWVIYDAKVADRTIPGLYRPVQADSLGELAECLGLDARAVQATVTAFNTSCLPSCRFDLGALDDCGTHGLEPPKSHWARPIDTPPYFGYPLRPGITFTYLGVAVDRRARVQHGSGAFQNLFAAGEIMAGNVLTEGYLAGFGMTIGTVWGRIAGKEAACSSSI